MPLPSSGQQAEKVLDLLGFEQYNLSNQVWTPLTITNQEKVEVVAFAEPIGNTPTTATAIRVDRQIGPKGADNESQYDIFPGRIYELEGPVRLILPQENQGQATVWWRRVK